MNVIDKIEKEQCKKEGADFKVGDTVKVYTKIVEGTTERIQLFTGAYSEVGTVFKASRRTVVSCCDYLIVVYYYCTEIPAQAGSPLTYRFGYVKVVIYLISSFHSLTFLKTVFLILSLI